MPAYDYDCAEINNMLLAETGRYMQGKLARRLSPRGKWRNAIPFEKWQDGMGVVHNSIVWERTVPTNEGDEWTENTPSTGTADSQCDLTPEIIEFGQSTRSWRKSSRNIRTPWFCLEDLRDDHRVKDMLTALQKNLGWVAHYVWENRIQDEYDRLMEHKLTENNHMDIEGTAFDPGSPPTSKLTVGTLRQIYQYLMADGAGEEGAIGLTTGGHPVLQLFTDMNTDVDLIQQDPELRQDFRYDPEKVKLLTRAYGMERSWDGYQHVYNPFQPRFEIVNGEYVRIQPFSDPEAATKGKKQLLQKEYLYATYAKSYVVIPQVFTMEVPNAITSPGGRLEFKAVDYMGDFAWLNILDAKCNPRGQKGFFDAVFTSAARPEDTWFGFGIMHLNCPPLRTGVDCYEYEQYQVS
jgi:hypothetical protein